MPKYYSPEGNLEVWEQKPQGYYTVEEWEEMHPPTPYVPTIDEQIEMLDHQYNSDKAVLMSQYTEADIDGDSELKESIKAELVALREQYDSDYEEIVGGAE